MNEDLLTAQTLSQAFSNYEEKAKEPNPQFLQLMQIRETWHEESGFEGTALVDMTEAVVKKLIESSAVLRDRRDRINLLREKVSMKEIVKGNAPDNIRALPDVERMDRERLILVYKLKDDKLNPEGFPIWQRDIPILPKGENMDKYLEKFKSNREATEALMKMWKINSPEEILALVADMAKQITTTMEEKAK